MYWAKITLNIEELMIDVDVKINDLLPFCSKVSFMDFLQYLLSAKMTLFMLVLPGLFQQRGPWGSLSETVENDNLKGTDNKFIVVAGNIWMLQLFINTMRTMTLCAIPQYFCFGSIDTELSLSINCTMLHTCSDFRGQLFVPVY